MDNPDKRPSDAQQQKADEFLGRHPFFAAMNVLAAMNVEIARAGVELEAYHAKEKADLEAKTAEARMQADLDPLTDIKNRRGLEQAYKKVQEARNRNHRNKGNTDAYLYFIDGDDFKGINKEHGYHDGGDKMLVGIAKSMQSSVRSRDIVGRWGGDEFLVIVFRTPEERALEIANNIRENVKETTVGTVSIGVGLLDYNLSLEENRARADQALQAAKEGGKDIVVHFDQLGPAILPPSELPPI